MRIKRWYYRHFDNEKLLEELSKPVDGEYVVVKEGNMLTRIRKEELTAYAEYLKDMGNFYNEAYKSCISKCKEVAAKDLSQNGSGS